MLHAKTAVADGRWARVGSTNLNIASWLSNWELDVVAEDEGFAAEMQAMYLDDLSHATENCPEQQAASPAHCARRMRTRPRGAVRGSANWAAKGVLRMGKVVGAAVTRSRLLGPAEASLMLSGGLTLLGIVVVAIIFPRVVAGVLAIVAAWIALTLLVQAWRLRFAKKAGWRFCGDGTRPGNAAGVPVIQCKSTAGFRSITPLAASKTGVAANARACC